MNIEELNGKKLTDVKLTDGSLEFICDDGSIFLMYHDQNCCESVYIDEITPEWREILIGQTVTYAYESMNQDLGPKSGWESSYTWTFYRISTTAGQVVIRWYGTSNGYYSERVSFIQTAKPQDENRPLIGQQREIDGHIYRLS